MNVRIAAALAALVTTAAVTPGLAAAAVPAQTDLPTTLSVDQPVVLLGTKVYLSGTGDPLSRVDFASQTSLQQQPVPAGHKTTHSDGTFEIGTTPSEFTGYSAEINGKLAAAGVETFTKVVRATATPLGAGQVRWAINGAPSRLGYINIYRQEPNGRFIRIGHIRSDRYGDGTLVTTSAVGTAAFQAAFQVPNSTPRTTTLTVAVR
jgi:hypothetical protein